MISKILLQKLIVLKRTTFKFLSLTIFLIWIASVFVSTNIKAMTTNPNNMYWYCNNFDKKQLKFIRMLSNVLQQKWDLLDKKASNDVNSKEYQKAKDLRLTFVYKLQSTYNCVWWYKNYDDFIQWLIWYFIQLKKLSKNTWYENFDKAYNIILKLQQKLFFKSNILLNWTIKDITNQNIKIWAKNDWWFWFLPTFDLNLLINSQSFINYKTQKIDSNSDISFNLNLTQVDYYDNNWNDWNINISWNTTLNIKSLNNIVYFMIRNFNFNVVWPEEEKNDINSNLTNINKILNKRIKIPKQEQEILSNTFKKFDLTKIFYVIKNKPLLEFLYKEWNTYFAIPSKNLCNLFVWIDKQNCINSINEIKKDTNWKWFITLTINKNNYKLWINTKFMNKKNIIEDQNKLSNLEKTNFVWNDNKIQSLNIYFYNDNDWLFINNNNIKFSLHKTWEYNTLSLNVTWKILNNWINLQWLSNINWLIAYIKYSFKKNKTDYSSKLNVSLEENWEKKWWLDYNINKNITSINNHNFVIPNKDVITLDDAKQYLDK